MTRRRVRDGSVAEADCGNGCQDCQDTLKMRPGHPGLWLAGGGCADVWLAELSWQSFFYPVIWKCCNNNLKTIGMREYGIKSIHLMLNLWSIQVQMWMSWTFHSWSMLSVCVTMCPHENFIQHLAEECLLLMQLRPAQGPESQQFHDHLHDDIERGFKPEWISWPSQGPLFNQDDETWPAVSHFHNVQYSRFLSQKKFRF